MAVYKHSSELKHATLHFGDIILFEGIFEMEVKDAYLNHGWNQNDFPFLMLRKNPLTFCKKYYGYAPLNNVHGGWPSSKKGDYFSLTKLVLALMKIFERSNPIKSLLPRLKSMPEIQLPILNFN